MNKELKTYVNELKKSIESEIPLENNQCFDNCITALEYGLVDMDEWFYTEGVIEAPYSWIYHGWLTNRAGEIWDITLNKDENVYHPRYFFNSYEVYDLMQQNPRELPLTRRIYLETLNKDEVVYDGYEFPGFDYTKWPEDYQGHLSSLVDAFRERCLVST
jgi:hypothetical protein